jgi:wyosine [tRNA(Phe)-imidazoG37] synthetase (radical SAM superfamily)
VSRRLKSFPTKEIDYLTFVPDGEPTLDLNLGKEIELLKPLGIKIAVLTNASLLFRADVRSDLAKADVVSLKIDAISENVWRKINRPHGSLKLKNILEGIVMFSEEFHGKIVSETMLLDGVNDSKEEIGKIGVFLSSLKLAKAYIAIPTRPPAESWVKPASEKTVNQAYQVFSKSLGRSKVEYLIGCEGSDFAFTGNVEQDILSITSVHPMRLIGF